MSRIYSGICFLEEKALIFLCALMAIMIFLQVFCRYILNQPLMWTSDVAKYGMVWMTFLGGSYVLRVKRHITIEIFMARMPGKVQKITSTIINLGILAVLIIAIWGAIPFLRMISMVASVTLDISMGYVYVSFIVGFGLMGLHLLKDIFFPGKSKQRV